MIAESVSDIHRITLPGSTLKRGERANVFWLDAAGGVLIDTGWNTDESFSALISALPRRPRHILVTHLHPDHGGAVARLMAWSGAAVWVPHEDLWLSETAIPDSVRYFEGESPVMLAGLRVDVVHTPGHTPGHRCFHICGPEALVTGDMVLGEGSTWVGPPHGDMALYMKSLERLLTRDHRLLLPGHGPIQSDPLLKIREFLEHRLARERQILSALGRGLSRAAEIVADVYTDTPSYLHPLAESVVHSHVAKLISENRVVNEGGGWRAVDR